MKYLLKLITLFSIFTIITQLYAEETIIKKTYYLRNYSGTHYEIGQQKAKFMKEAYPEYTEWLTSIEENKKLPDEEFNKIRDFIDIYCPSINDEINGFADYLGVEQNAIRYYDFVYKKSGNCSHFSVLGEKTTNNHILVGRSFEYHPDSQDLTLTIVKPKGKFSYIGFAETIFGYDDGMNEHGLTITVSNASPGSKQRSKGLMCGPIIKNVLENCKNVDEAIKLMKKIPQSSCFNYIITDRSGKSVLFEFAGDKYDFKIINEKSEDKVLYSTNAFEFPSLQEFDGRRKHHSDLRYNFIKEQLSDSKDKIDINKIKKMLSTEIPYGLACHHYSDYLGTLWSMVFDVTDLKISICFGSSITNEWYEFDFNKEYPNKIYQVKLPNETADPKLWQFTNKK